MAIAYPFVEVQLDDKGLMPVATRAPGVVAIVGASNGGAVAANVPTPVDDIPAVTEAFGAGPLARSLGVALKQQPSPSKVYGLRIADDTRAGWSAAFDVLSGVADVTIVAAAERPIRDFAGNALNIPAMVRAHCDENSAGGQPRIGVAAIDPALPRENYAAAVTGLLDPYKHDFGRMVVVAARGARYAEGGDADVAAACAAAIGARAPETSMVLKSVAGFRIAPDLKFSPGEIKALAGAEVIPIIDPMLIPGESLHFAEGTTLGSKAAFKYIDIVRLLDDVDFALKANLVGMVGDARITRAGLNAVRRTLEGVLDGYVIRQAITSYRILIDILPILDKPEAGWTAAEQKLVRDARAERVVNATVIIVIGPAIHRIVINLQPTFAAA